MAALETRLLLLGAVRLFGPVNGYQIRRELLSWQVDEWAFIAPGSIYSGLNTLTKQGHVRRHDLLDGGREVAVYQLTDDGEGEFRTLLSEAICRVTPTSGVAFRAGLSLLPQLPRLEALVLLQERAFQWRHVLAECAEFEAAGSEFKPPHVVAMAGLSMRTGEAELDWLKAFISSIQDGALTFEGEPDQWLPPEGDPGWQMAADRERYESLLGVEVASRKTV